MRHIFRSIFQGLKDRAIAFKESLGIGTVRATMTGTFPRRVACVTLLTLVLPAAVAAQGTYPQAAPPAGGAANPVCGRLEAQLAAIDRGVSADPARAEQTRRIEETLNKQQADLDRTQSQWQRLRVPQPEPLST